MFDVDRDENYGRLCFYLMLIMCIFALQVFSTMQMCFNYLTFGFCLTLYSSGSDIPGSRKMRKLDLKVSGVSNEKKVGEED